MSWACFFSPSFPIPSPRHPSGACQVLQSLASSLPPWPPASPPTQGSPRGPFKRRWPGGRPQGPGGTHPLVGLGAEGVQSNLAREVCDAGDVGVVLLQSRQAHLLPSSTQRLHLEFSSRAPLEGAESRTGRCHRSKVPPAESAPSTSASSLGLPAWPYGSYHAPLRPHSGPRVPASLGPRSGQAHTATGWSWQAGAPGASFPQTALPRRRDRGRRRALSKLLPDEVGA